MFRAAFDAVKLGVKTKVGEAVVKVAEKAASDVGKFVEKEGEEALQYIEEKMADEVEQVRQLVNPEGTIVPLTIAPTDVPTLYTNALVLRSNEIGVSNVVTTTDSRNKRYHQRKLTDREMSQALVPYKGPMTRAQRKRLQEAKLKAKRTQSELASLYQQNFAIAALNSQFILKKFSNRKMGKGSKYVTRRGVKRMIAERAAYEGKYTFIGQMFDIYMGYAPAGVPSIRYGYCERGSFILVTRNTLVAWNNIVDNNTIDKTTGHNETDNYAYRYKKGKINWIFHNPVNEKVRAKLWWVRCKQNCSSSFDASVLWTQEYNQKKDVATAINHENDFMDYPTKYKEFNDYWEIVDKQKVVFAPGQTLTWKTKIRVPGPVKLQDMTADVNQAGFTYALMWELAGVPTHQNDAGVQTDKVSYSPAALDVIGHISCEGARTTSTGALHNVLNGLGPVTSAKAQVATAGQDYVTT